MFKYFLGCVAFFLAGVGAAGQPLLVIHDHDPWGSCAGVLEIGDSGIEFRSEKEEHVRNWSWIDIQSFDRRSGSRFSIVTWEDQKWKLGLDRSFDFEIAPGSPELTSELFARIRDRLKGLVTDRVARPVEAEYSVPVKHLHTLGGCEGTLHFGPDWIVYDTDHAEDARSWKRGRDVESFWSSTPYTLEVHVFEENQKAFQKTRRFRFQLKEPLDRNYYDKLRREMVANP